MKLKTKILSLIAITNCILAAPSIDHKIEKIDENTEKIHINIELPKDELLLKESLYTTVNNPNVTLGAVKSNSPISTAFIPSYNKNKEVYKDKATLTLEAKKTANDGHNSVLHVYLQTTAEKNPVEHVVTLFKDDKKDVAQAQPTGQKYALEEKATCYVNQPSFLGGLIQSIGNFFSSLITKTRTYISSTFETSTSIYIKLLAALILGILLSLTPCMYPMIPITVGLLQSKENKSVFRNFLMAFTYTLGISSTFAILGFLTAIGSCVFGELQSTSWLILPLIALLIYLGLSMFGLYEMYIPRFMQPKNTQVVGGSFVSVFVFGLISGTVASPCLSPGLALILSHVAKVTQQAGLINYFDGFVTLFAFGVGSSLPLLIIGTFSSSMSMLPRAGMWMVEVKRLLGIMLLGMAFYHLEKFIPWFILSWFVVIFLFTLGVYFFASKKSYDSAGMKSYKIIMGVLFIIGSCVAAIEAYKSVYLHYNPESKQSIWLTDYDLARNIAKKENKKLFVDFGTTHCAICKVIEERIDDSVEIKSALRNYVPVKVDGSETSVEPFAHLQKKLDVKGFPTIVILDPNDEREIKKWVGEIPAVATFVDELNSNK